MTSAPSVSEFLASEAMGWTFTQKIALLENDFHQAPDWVQAIFLKKTAALKALLASRPSLLTESYEEKSAFQWAVGVLNAPAVRLLGRLDPATTPADLSPALLWTLRRAEGPASRATVQSLLSLGAPLSPRACLLALALGSDWGSALVLKHYPEFLKPPVMPLAAASEGETKPGPEAEAAWTSDTRAVFEIVGAEIFWSMLVPSHARSLWTSDYPDLSPSALKRVKAWVDARYGKTSLFSPETIGGLLARVLERAPRFPGGAVASAPLVGEWIDLLGEWFHVARTARMEKQGVPGGTLKRARAVAYEAWLKVTEKDTPQGALWFEKLAHWLGPPPEGLLVRALEKGLAEMVLAPTEVSRKVLERESLLRALALWGLMAPLDAPGAAARVEHWMAFMGKSPKAPLVLKELVSQALFPEFGSAASVSAVLRGVFAWWRPPDERMEQLWFDIFLREKNSVLLAAVAPGWPLQKGFESLLQRLAARLDSSPNQGSPWAGASPTPASSAREDARYHAAFVFLLNHGASMGTPPVRAHLERLAAARELQNPLRAWVQQGVLDHRLAPALGALEKGPRPRL